MRRDMYCPICGMLQTEGAKFCPNCGLGLSEDAVKVQSTVLMPYKKKKSVALSVILSFIIIGLGLIYLRDYKKGFAILFVALVSIKSG